MKFPVSPSLLALLAALVLTGGGCSLFQDREKTASLVCPVIEIDRTTSTLTRFRQGAGRDITDVDLTAEIQGYSGDCGYGESGIDVSLMVRFGATRGPAASVATAEFDYFVAVSHIVPAAAGRPLDHMILNKELFTVRTEFPPDVDTVLYRDEEVKVTIPLKRDDLADNYVVSIGLQLNREQLEYNRTHHP
ncbi:MAG: hypothetical protein ABT940_12410 [Alphaproteobacteria bacterium]